MFSHFLVTNKPKSRPDVVINNRSVWPTSSSVHHSANNHHNYCNGYSSSPRGGGGGGFWSAWNLWPSSIRKTTATSCTSPKSSSKYNYKDVAGQDRYVKQQRQSLIDKHHHHHLDIELQNMNNQEEQQQEETNEFIPTPPMSPSLFILPRCMQNDQCYSPVKLVALPERKPKRIKFRAVETESLIEKFDKITIIQTRTRRKSGSEVTTTTSDEEEDKENKRSHSSRVGEGQRKNRVLSERRC